MFNIRYNILKETIKSLQYITLEEFNQGLSDIEGQIELNFNGNTEGDVDDDFNFGDELLVLWYSCLNNIVYILKSNKYAAFEIPDTDHIWLEFVTQDTFLYVSEKKLDVDAIEDVIIDKQLKEFSNWGWSDAKIDKNEFFMAISKSTKEFIESISNINHTLLESETVKELISFYKANL